MTEQRQFYRARSSKRIELVHRGTCHTGSLDNISLNGALVHLTEDPGLAGGEGCMLRIHLEPDPAPRPALQLWTEVVHSSSQLLGLKFVDRDLEGCDCFSLLMELVRDEPDRAGEDLERLRGHLARYCGTR